MMHYPVVMHKDKGSDFGVTVPDLPGCFSAGKTVDEAVKMVREAMELHIEGMVEEGALIPPAGSIEEYRSDPTYADGVWALVPIDPGTVRMQIKRINITIPERVLDAVDHYAKEHGETRSGLLAQAAIQFIGRKEDGTLRPARPPGRRKKQKGKRAATVDATLKRAERKG